MMNKKELGASKRAGSVKAAIRVYGDRILEGSSSILNKTHMDTNSEMSYSKTRELHKVKRDIGRYKETRDEAESAKAQAESDLRAAKNTARDLSSLLRESSSNTRAHKREIGGSSLIAINDDKYDQIVRELESVKQELQMLKLDMASVLEEKSRAGEIFELARAKLGSLSSSTEEVKREIEDSSCEQVLVELARIEAVREREEIEAERAKEAVRFSHSIERTRRKIADAADEIERSRELEPELATVLAEIDVSNHELRRARRRDESLSLESLTEALREARKELAAVKEEGFQCMASMDVIRTELGRVKAEAARLEDSERRKESEMQSLNARLVRAKAKLGFVSTAAERASSIASSLSATLEKLKSEAEDAGRERAAAAREASEIREETRRQESEIESSEEKLRDAIRALEEAKASENSALESLRIRIESTIGTRSDVLKQSSSITISRFEHEYLIGRAGGACELAEKKVAAARGWVEAIRANEREIAMKIDFVQREMREMRIEEEREAFKMERSFSAKRRVERDLLSWGPKRAEADGFKLGMHKRSIRANNNNNVNNNGNIGTPTTPSRRAKFRGSGSPGGARFRGSASPGGARSSFPIKKKKQVLPSIAKLFKAGKAEKGVV